MQYCSVCGQGPFSGNRGVSIHQRQSATCEIVGQAADFYGKLDEGVDHHHQLTTDEGDEADYGGFAHDTNDIAEDPDSMSVDSPIQDDIVHYDEDGTVIPSPKSANMEHQELVSNVLLKYIKSKEEERELNEITGPLDVDELDVFEQLKLDNDGEDDVGGPNVMLDDSSISDIEPENDSGIEKTDKASHSHCLTEVETVRDPGEDSGRKSMYPPIDGPRSESFEPGKVWVSPTMDRDGTTREELSESLRKSIKLMLKTRSRQGPLALYKEIVEFTREEMENETQLLYKDEVFSEIRKKFPHLPCKKIRYVTADAGKTTKKKKVKIPVVCFDVWPQIYSILNDSELMTPEFLCVNELLPYMRHAPGPEMDLQDGKMFQDFLKRFYESPGNIFFLMISFGGVRFATHNICFVTGGIDHEESINFVIGLIAFVDKTFTDKKGRYNLEPVVVTLSCFNRKGRANPRAWIILGFVTQLGNTSAIQTNMEKGQQNQIFHHQLRECFRDFHEHNSQATMQLHLCGKKVIRHVTFPLLCFLGDGQGSDFVCGRYGAYSTGTGRIAWKCDTPPQDMVGVYTRINHTGAAEYCNFLDAEEVEKQVAIFHDSPAKSEPWNAAQKWLHKRAQHTTELFTFGGYLLLASTKKQGIFSLCCNCTLHSINLGVVKSTIETILSRLTHTSKACFDSYVRENLFVKNRQSRVQTLFYRTSFKALCSLTKLTGKETLGLLFSWMVCTRSGIGRTALTMSEHGNIPDEKLFDYTNGESFMLFGEDRHVQTLGRVFEMLLTYERHIMVPGSHLWNPNGTELELQEGQDRFQLYLSAMMSCLFWVFPFPLVLDRDEDGKTRPISNKTNMINKAKQSDASTVASKLKGSAKKKGELASPRAKRPKNNHPTRRDAQEPNSTDSIQEEINEPTPPPAKTDDKDRRLPDETRIQQKMRERPRKASDTRTWYNQKMYLPLHQGREISLFGVAANVDTSAPECNHKKFAKLPAASASKQGLEAFSDSSSDRVQEMVELEHAHAYSNSTFSQPDKGNTGRSTKDVGKKFMIRASHGDCDSIPSIYLAPRSRNESRKKGYRSYSIYPERIASFVRLRLEDGESKGDYLCSTEVRLPNGDSVRCSPSFQKGVVFDWVLIPFGVLKGELPRYTWENNTTLDDACPIPCQLACVVLSRGGTPIYMNGEYHEKVAIVRPCLDLENDHNRSLRSKLLRRWRKLYHRQTGDYQSTGDPVLCCVPTKEIIDQVIVYEDFPSVFGNRDSFVEERNRFLHLFCAKKHQAGGKDHLEGIAYLKQDWAYSVIPKENWPRIFNELCKPAAEVPGVFSKTYMPPDPPSVAN